LKGARILRSVQARGHDEAVPTLVFLRIDVTHLR
jgi:hypothetical protein